MDLKLQRNTKKKKKIQLPTINTGKHTKTIGRMVGNTTKNLIRIIPNLNLFYNTPLKNYSNRI